MKALRSLREVDEGKLSADVFDMVLNKIIQIEQETELIKQLRQIQIDVAEIYSPPRVTKMAEKMGLKAGEAMDLITGWDFTLQRHREAAMEYVKRVKPKLVIGSPQCRMFSSMQHLNQKKHTVEHQEQLV